MPTLLSRTPIPLLLLFFFILLHYSSLAFSKTTPTNFSFQFQSLSFRNLTLLGDAYLRSSGSVGLTRETGVPSSSSGTASLNLPIRLLDPTTNLSASFSTNFTFSVTNPNPDSDSAAGDGLTFFLSPTSSTLGATGAYLGLFNSSPSHNAASIIAIEFDTNLDQSFHDPSDNHVGFDVNNPVSIKTADIAIDLKNGNPITAWIDYCRDNVTLTVFLSNNNTKPQNPVLSIKFDLSKHFQEYMYAGFSASTEGSTELHTIDNWSFQTFGLSGNLNISSRNQNNVSDASWSSIPSLPITDSTAHSRKGLSFGLVILGPVTFAVILVLVLWFLIKKKLMLIKQGQKSDFLNGPRKFSYRELSSATRGFHCGRIVGNGAFGTVYRAADPKSGADYAVKRSKQAHESKTEFTAELTIIASLRHRNLVQLQGWCTDKNELLLVYEFMPNGSLDSILYPRPASGPDLSWDRRYNVATGIASVLAYLHQECDQRVIHRDIKTSNIMLDSEFSPRLGDFGLARLMDHNTSPVSTLTAGTMGYLAPEYLQYGKYTEKTDVFSYGVVVLEVCCGRRPIDKEGEGKDSKLVNLVDWVWGLHTKDKIMDAVDKRLLINGEFDKDGMLRLLLLGLSCVNPNCEDRPSMRRVVQILNREAEPLAVPKVKPLLSFGSSSSLSLLEIVSDSEAEGSGSSSSLYEVKIS